jgi:hypothetical protein
MVIRVYFEGKDFLGTKPQLSFIEMPVGSNDEAQRVLSEAHAKGFLQTKNEWVPYHRIRHVERF